MSTHDTLKKAYIQAHDQNGKEINDPIPVLFNPEQLSIDKSNQYSSVGMPGQNVPVIQFVKGESETLSLDLLFDTYTYNNSEDVRNYTCKITDLMKINEDIHAPPVCTFHWGEISFAGIIEKIGSKFTMFKADGTPVRAVLSLTFRQYQECVECKIRSSPDRTKIFVVREDYKNRLDLIAFETYGDPSKWKEIAKANNIKDPLLLPDTLNIPPLEL